MSWSQRSLRHLTLGLTTAAAAIAGGGDASAQSFGVYAMPSRFTQYLGYGYGAGHHAPIVKTPAQHPPRVPRHVKAPAECGPLYVAPVVPVGCGGDSCYSIPATYPAPAPVVAPSPTVAPQEDRRGWRFHLP